MTFHDGLDDREAESAADRPFAGTGRVDFVEAVEYERDVFVGNSATIQPPEGRPECLASPGQLTDQCHRAPETVRPPR